MLALQLANELAQDRRSRGGIRCPWEQAGIHPTDGLQSTAMAGDGNVLSTPPEDDELVDRSTTIEQNSTALPSAVGTSTVVGRSQVKRIPGRSLLPLNSHTLTATRDQLLQHEKTPAGQGYFHTPVHLLGQRTQSSPHELARGQQQAQGQPQRPEPLDTTPTGPWQFEAHLTQRFPALLKRNFACIQEHQATRYHFDLRLQINGGTFSWAIPKGFMDLEPGRHHAAIQTPIHPISYSVHEGSDGRVFRNGVRCGTLLWDICEYAIGSPLIERHHSPTSSHGSVAKADDDGDSLGRNVQRETDSADPDGKYEEAQLDLALYGKKAKHKPRYIKLVLKNGRKFRNHSFTLFQVESATTFDSRGYPKKQWMLKLGHGVTRPLAYPEDAAKSVLTGRTLQEVVNAGTKYFVPRLDEQAPDEEEQWAGQDAK